MGNILGKLRWKKGDTPPPPTNVNQPGSEDVPPPTPEEKEPTPIPETQDKPTDPEQNVVPEKEIVPKEEPAKPVEAVKEEKKDAIVVEKEEPIPQEPIPEEEVKQEPTSEEVKEVEVPQETKQEPTEVKKEDVPSPVESSVDKVEEELPKQESKDETNLPKQQSQHKLTIEAESPPQPIPDEASQILSLNTQVSDTTVLDELTVVESKNSPGKILATITIPGPEHEVETEAQNIVESKKSPQSIETVEKEIETKIEKERKLVVEIQSLKETNVKEVKIQSSVENKETTNSEVEIQALVESKDTQSIDLDNVKTSVEKEINTEVVQETKEIETQPLDIIKETNVEEVQAPSLVESQILETVTSAEINIEKETKVEEVQAPSLVESEILETVTSTEIETVKETKAEEVQAPSLVESEILETVTSAEIDTIKETKVEEVQAPSLEESEILKTITSAEIESVKEAKIEEIETQPLGENKEAESIRIEDITIPTEVIKETKIEDIEAQILKKVQSLEAATISTEEEIETEVQKATNLGEIQSQSIANTSLTPDKNIVLKSVPISSIDGKPTTSEESVVSLAPIEEQNNSYSQEKIVDETVVTTSILPESEAVPSDEIVPLIGEEQSLSVTSEILGENISQAQIKEPKFANFTQESDTFSLQSQNKESNSSITISESIPSVVEANITHTEDRTTFDQPSIENTETFPSNIDESISQSQVAETNSAIFSLEKSSTTSIDNKSNVASIDEPLSNIEISDSTPISQIVEESKENLKEVSNSEQITVQLQSIITPASVDKVSIDESLASSDQKTPEFSVQNSSSVEVAQVNSSNEGISQQHKEETLSVLSITENGDIDSSIEDNVLPPQNIANESASSIASDKTPEIIKVDDKEKIELPVNISDIKISDLIEVSNESKSLPLVEDLISDTQIAISSSTQESKLFFQSEKELPTPHLESQLPASTPKSSSLLVPDGQLPTSILESQLPALTPVEPPILASEPPASIMQEVEEKPVQNSTEIVDIELTEEEIQGAVVKIQAGVRGYLARKAIKNKDSAEVEEETQPKGVEEPQQSISIPSDDAKTREINDSTEKQVQDEKDIDESLMDLDNLENPEEVEGAVVKLQAGYRGFKARRDVKEIKKQKETKPQEESETSDTSEATKNTQVIDVILPLSPDEEQNEINNQTIDEEITLIKTSSIELANSEEVASKEEN